MLVLGLPLQEVFQIAQDLVQQIKLLHDRSKLFWCVLDIAEELANGLNRACKLNGEGYHGGGTGEAVHAKEASSKER